jgi:hypothetical protein
MYLLLRHIAQTKPGVVDPVMLDEGFEHYERVRKLPFANSELDLK